MHITKGCSLRQLSVLFSILQLCCAAVVFGTYAYFVGVLLENTTGPSKDVLAVVSISGITLSYTIFAVLLTCFFRVTETLSFLAIGLDIVFCASFIAIAAMTREGARGCHGLVITPLGVGNTVNEDMTAYAAYQSNRLVKACRLNAVCFALSIVGASVKTSIVQSRNINKS